MGKSLFVIIMNRAQLTTVILMVCLFSLSAQSGSTLMIVSKSGQKVNYPLSTIRNITYSSGNMNINKTNAVSEVFSITDVRFMNFNLNTAIEKIDLDENQKLQIFPNPAVDFVTLKYPAQSNENIRVDFFNLQAKLFYSKTIASQTGVNNYTLPVVALPSGLYICRIQNGQKTEYVKFVKN